MPTTHFHPSWPGRQLSRPGCFRRQLGKRVKKPLSQIFLIGQDFSRARERIDNRDRLAKGGACPLWIGRADVVEGDGEIGLPSRLGRVGGRKPAADGEALLVSRKRRRAVIRVEVRVAKLVEDRTQVALPLSIVGVCRGELAPDGESFLIGDQRSLWIVRIEPYFAYFHLRRAQAALPLHVAWISG